MESQRKTEPRNAIEFNNTDTSQGVAVSQFKSSSSAAPAAGGAPPPPPPPPPPVAPPPPPAGAPAPAAGGISAVFEQLNRGEEVTKGLRKVDKSEMTHKNPALRAGGTVPATASAPAGRPASLSLGGSRSHIQPSGWEAAGQTQQAPGTHGQEACQVRARGEQVDDCTCRKSSDDPTRSAYTRTQEYQENQSALTVDNVEISQTVNLFGCKSSTVIIKGKVNAITLGE